MTSEEQPTGSVVIKRDGLYLAFVLENLYDLCSIAADGTTHRRELLGRLREILPDFKLQDKEAVKLLDQVLPTLLFLICI